MRWLSALVNIGSGAKALTVINSKIIRNYITNIFTISKF